MRMKTVKMTKAAKVPDWRDGGQSMRTLKKGAAVSLPWATANHLIKRGKAASGAPETADNPAGKEG